LSFSNFGSSRHENSERVRLAVEIIRKRCQELRVDGEMQADTAVRPERIEETYPFSSLLDGANVLVFPILDAGNIAYTLLRLLNIDVRIT
jgi:malate dehydrogenase (oxaloacetate-decarboxylating)(NADP+)